MLNKVEIPINPVELVLARKNAGTVNPSVRANNKGQLVPRNKDSSDGYTVTVRKSSNSGNMPEGARKLKDCKGLKGCDFAICAEKVFGKLPKNLKGVCPTNDMSHRVSIEEE